MAEYLGMTGPAAAYFQGRDMNQQIGDRAQAAQFQQAQSLMALIQAKQKMEQEQALRAAIQGGDPKAIMSIPGGVDYLGKVNTIQRGQTGQLLDMARIGDYGRRAEEDARKAAIETTQRGHVTSLQDLFNPQTYARPELTHPADIVAPNDAAAIEALKQAEARGQPFTVQVPNPSAVRANVIGAGSALPAQVGRELLQGLTPKPATNNGFSLSPGQTRFGPDNQPIASLPDRPVTGPSERAPSGYRFNANRELEPIPGGPADRAKNDKGKAQISPEEAATIVEKEARNLQALIQINPKSAASILSGINRGIESVIGLGNDEYTGPALSAQSSRQRLLFAIDQLIKSGKSSNEFLRRIESAIGASGVTTPGNAMSALDEAVNLAMGLAGKQAPSDASARTAPSAPSAPRTSRKSAQDFFK